MVRNADVSLSPLEVFCFIVTNNDITKWRDIKVDPNYSDIQGRKWGWPSVLGVTICRPHIGRTNELPPRSSPSAPSNRRQRRSERHSIQNKGNLLQPIQSIEKWSILFQGYYCSLCNNWGKLLASAKHNWNVMQQQCQSHHSPSNPVEQNDNDASSISDTRILKSAVNAEVPQWLEDCKSSANAETLGGGGLQPVQDFSKCAELSLKISQHSSAFPFYRATVEDCVESSFMVECGTEPVYLCCSGHGWIYIAKSKNLFRLQSSLLTLLHGVPVEDEWSIYFATVESKAV